MRSIGARISRVAWSLSRGHVGRAIKHVRLEADMPPDTWKTHAAEEKPRSEVLNNNL